MYMLLTLLLCLLIAMLRIVSLCNAWHDAPAAEVATSSECCVMTAHRAALQVAAGVWPAHSWCHRREPPA
jgi:hypothetical protein